MHDQPQLPDVRRPADARDERRHPEHPAVFDGDAAHRPAVGDPRGGEAGLADLLLDEREVARRQRRQELAQRGLVARLEPADVAHGRANQSISPGIVIPCP